MTLPETQQIERKVEVLAKAVEADVPDEIAKQAPWAADFIDQSLICSSLEEAFVAAKPLVPSQPRSIKTAVLPGTEELTYETLIIRELFKQCCFCVALDVQNKKKDSGVAADDTLLLWLIESLQIGYAAEQEWAVLALSSLKFSPEFYKDRFNHWTSKIHSEIFARNVINALAHMNTLGALTSFMYATEKDKELLKRTEPMHIFYFPPPADESVHFIKDMIHFLETGEGYLGFAVASVCSKECFEDPNFFAAVEKAIATPSPNKVHGSFLNSLLENIARLEVPKKFSDKAIETVSRNQFPHPRGDELYEFQTLQSKLT